MEKLSTAFFVPGDPRPKGSLRIFGASRFIPASADMKEWCHRVTEAAKVATPTRELEGPVTVRMRFVIRRPKGHYGAQGRVRPTAPVRPAKKPDIDKLVRAVLDAITVAGVWLDDAQVVRLDADKSYGAEPGVHIFVEST